MLTECLTEGNRFQSQPNLKLATFLLYCRWRCTFYLEVTRVHEGTVCLLMGHKRLKDKYYDPDMLPKANKANMTGTIEDIKQ